MTYDLIIEHGTVATAADTFKADIAVKDGRIVAIGAAFPDAHERIDATGKLVLPGGIDSHVHLDQDAAGAVMGDDFETGTRSAVFGGNTMVLPFCLQKPGQSLREALTDYHGRAKDKCYCDVSFHLIVADATPNVVGQELPALIEDGYTSIKVFMTYENMALSDRQILEVMEVAAARDAMVMVHAENFDAIKYLDEQMERQGLTSPPYHARSRPIPVEREATHRALALAELTGARTMVVHISNAEARDELVRARERGMRVFGETCPQYLTLTEADLEGDVQEGSKYVCSPPPRDIEAQKACWKGLERGIFDVFSSDHCPYRYDVSGKLNPNAQRGYKWIPNGVPGVETRLPILFSEGVNKGRIDINQFVALSATNHAKLYGLYPRKGTLAVGADADIAIWDPELEETISQKRLHHGCDYTPFEGMRVRGWPVTTILRGRVVVRDRSLCDSQAGGEYLTRPIS